MMKLGFNVVQGSENRNKFMIIDNNIVQYGGLDKSSLIRIQNEQLSNELRGIISELRYLRI